MSSKMLQANWIASNDSNTDVSSSTNVKQIQQRLQTEVGLPLKAFNKATECAIELNHPSSITEKQILILEANVANEALPLLYYLCHVVYIFVYWINCDESLMNSLKQLQSKYTKVSVYKGFYSL